MSPKKARIQSWSNSWKDSPQVFRPRQVNWSGSVILKEEQAPLDLMGVATGIVPVMADCAILSNTFKDLAMGDAVATSLLEENDEEWL